MELTIEQLQNEIMAKVVKYEFTDQVLILRELEDFCARQADDALKMAYDFAAMEDEQTD